MTTVATRGNLRTRRLLAQESHGVFTVPALNWLLFNAKRNGLAESGAIIKLGRRVLIDAERFYAWVESHRRERESS